MLVFTKRSLFWTVWPQKNPRTFPKFQQNSRIFQDFPGLFSNSRTFLDVPGLVGTMRLYRGMIKTKQYELVPYGLVVYAFHFLFAWVFVNWWKLKHKYFTKQNSAINLSLFHSFNNLHKSLGFLKNNHTVSSLLQYHVDKYSYLRTITEHILFKNHTKKCKFSWKQKKATKNICKEKSLIFILFTLKKRTLLSFTPSLLRRYYS